MNNKEYNIRVQALFPYEFETALCKDYIKGILDESLRKVFSTFEKIETIELTGSTTLDRAATVLRVVPSIVSVGDLNVFDYTMRQSLTERLVNYYFDPNTKQFLLSTSEYGSVSVEYVVDEQFLTISDLDEEFSSWVVEYANAILSIKEGFLGTRAVVNVLPIDTNYADLRSYGETEKIRLEDKLEDMFFGLFSGKN